MDYKTTDSLQNLTWADFVDFGECQDRNDQFFDQKNSNFLNLNLHVERKITRELRIFKKEMHNSSNLRCYKTS